MPSSKTCRFLSNVFINFKLLYWSVYASAFIYTRYCSCQQTSVTSFYTCLPFVTASVCQQLVRAMHFTERIQKLGLEGSAIRTVSNTIQFPLISSNQKRSKSSLPMKRQDAASFVSQQRQFCPHRFWEPRICYYTFSQFEYFLHLLQTVYMHLEVHCPQSSTDRILICPQCLWSVQRNHCYTGVLVRMFQSASSLLPQSLTKASGR